MDNHDLSQFRSLNRVIASLEAAWVPVTEPRDGLYAWEPLPLDQFLPGLELAAVAAPGRFLDVGCGIGTKMLVAQQYGWQPHGLEIRPEFAEAARRLVPEAEVTTADAMHFDGYGDYDFIYCYRPFVDDDTEDRLERHIIGQLAIGAWLFLPHRNWLPIEARGDLHAMGTPIWRRAW